MNRLFLLALAALMMMAGCTASQQMDGRYADELIRQKDHEIAERDRKIAEQNRELEQASATVQAVDAYLQETHGKSVADLPKRAAADDPPPPPPERPAANPAADPFGLMPTAPGVFFNGQAAGTVGNTASYINRNPQRGPCQGMCARVINKTRRKEAIVIVVDMEYQTIFGGFQPIAGAAEVALPDGTRMPGLMSVLPYGQKTEWRMDLTGSHDITVMGYIRRNDGWLVPTGYTTYTAFFPGRYAFGKEIPVRGFEHRI